METFLGMEVEQPGKVIRLHLDKYIRSVLDEYKEFIKKKSLRPKPLNVWQPVRVQQATDCLALDAAEDHSAVDG